MRMKVTKRLLAKIEKLARRGGSVVDIAIEIKKPITTTRELIKKNIDISEAYRKGALEFRSKLYKFHEDRANKGDPKSISWINQKEFFQQKTLLSLLNPNDRKLNIDLYIEKLNNSLRDDISTQNLIKLSDAILKILELKQQEKPKDNNNKKFTMDDFLLFMTHKNKEAEEDVS